jgi:hypothetical protein
VEILAQHAADAGRESHVSLQEIYNLKSGIKTMAREGRTPADAIIREMVKRGIPHRVRADPETEELQTLFFTSPLAIVLAKYYGYVLFMDATYKTNKYQMPFLHIVSMSPTNLTFTVGLCFLSGETQSEYIWALQSLQDLCGNLPTEVVLTDQCEALRNALTIVYPNWKQQLCTWHLGQNLVKHHKGKMSKEDFEEVKVASQHIASEPCEDEYEALVEHYTARFLARDKTAAAWQYVLGQHEQAEYFAAHRLQTTLNFGERATSRGEAFHRAIKLSMMSPTADLFTTVHAALIHMRSTHRKIFKLHATDILYTEKSFPPCMMSVSFLRLFARVCFLIFNVRLLTSSNLT